jgi:hypothetical protein
MAAVLKTVERKFRGFESLPLRHDLYLAASQRARKPPSMTRHEPWTNSASADAR